MGRASNQARRDKQNVEAARSLRQVPGDLAPLEAGEGYASEKLPAEEAPAGRNFGCPRSLPACGRVTHYRLHLAAMRANRNQEER